MRLSQLAINSSIDSPKVLKLQRTLALSLNFRLMAVRKVVGNTGSKTPGIDGITLETSQNKIDMVEKLRYHIKNPTLYKSLPVKRVMIPKANSTKKRPLGIPSIEDRCLQSLVNLVLLPLIEINSDKQSYGFRPYRNAKMALGSLRYNLRSEEAHYDKWILDADITGFFDNISHD